MPFTAAEVSEMANALKRDYVLIGIRTWYAFLGGALAFLVGAGIVSYKATLNAIGSTSAQVALGAIRADSVAARGIVVHMDTLRQRYQTTLAAIQPVRGLNAPIKVCLVTVTGAWRDGMAVPSSWTADDCDTYAKTIVTPESHKDLRTYLGCASRSGFTLGSQTNAAPRSNECDW